VANGDRPIAMRPLLVRRTRGAGRSNETHGPNELPPRCQGGNDTIELGWGDLRREARLLAA
jgi:hypothetical protein